MSTTESLRMRREAILAEMRGLEAMRRGTINEQYVPRGGESGGRRGPYYVWSRYEGGRTRSRRLKTAEELAQAREAVAAHKRFVSLCEEFLSVTEELADFPRRDAAHEGEKKRRKSPSSRMRK